jgi:large subunit ribosomal protein L10
MPNKQNIELLSTITEEIKAASAIWIVDYRGLTVKETEELRRAIRETGSSMAVRKNTLMRIALKDAELPEIDDVLEGPSAFVFASGDPVASAKAVKTFADAHEALVIKGGIMDGKAYNAEEVEAIAALPSRQELIAKLLGTINNPLTQIVRVLNAPMEYTARAISAIADQKNAA